MQNQLSQFEQFKLLPKRQAYEALLALLAVVNKYGLHDDFESLVHNEFGVNAWELGIQTFQGIQLMKESDDGLIPAFHDNWIDCPQCGEEADLNQVDCIEKQDGEQVWLCSDCFAAASNGDQQ